MAQTDVQFYPGMGLTTTKAPFIEVARNRGELYIEQPYELYSEENHEAWRRLYARMQERWQRYATDKFLEGISSFCLDPEPRAAPERCEPVPRAPDRLQGESGYGLCACLYLL